MADVARYNFEADPSLHTLSDFRYKRHCVAVNGEMGKVPIKTENGVSLIIKVPLGTMVYDGNTGKLWAIYGERRKGVWQQASRRQGMLDLLLLCAEHLGLLRMVRGEAR